jgi:predicted DsbA family dithiol-disulfide isomerase/SAM-dependent methyltransferase
MSSHASEAAVEIVHFADPWCWWSWGLESVIQRLKSVYGNQIEVNYRMGGITKDVSEWRREYDVINDEELRSWITDSISITGMPADPDYYLSTKVKSTWDACVAVKAAQLQGERVGEQFYRKLMETIQLESKNGSDEEVYMKVAKDVGLDLHRLKRDIASGKARELFLNDKKDMAVSFLTLTYVNRKTGEKKDVGNVFTAGDHEKAVDDLTRGSLVKNTPVDILEYMESRKGFAVPPKEIAEVFVITEDEARDRLTTLVGSGLLQRRDFRFGAQCWSFTKGAGEGKLTVEQVKAAHVAGPTQVATEANLAEIITRAVKGLYTQVANDPHKAYHFPLGRAALLYVGYPDKELNKLPETALESFAGVGYPHSSGLIRPGDTVLDVGVGSGTDALFASLLTGPKGKVLGVDITDAMIEKARGNIAKMGAKNVKIMKGDATKIPVEDASVDVVTSNGVLNLVPDKRKAFQEIYRILKPGGKIQIADIVVQTDVQKVCGLIPQLWADCIGGAAVENDYLKTIEDAGFKETHIVGRLDYFGASTSESTKRTTKTFGAETIVITAVKPR